MLFADGAGSSRFKGTLDNTKVFGKLKGARPVNGRARQVPGPARSTITHMRLLLPLWLLASSLLSPPCR